MNHYIAVSQANADYLTREKRLPAAKVTVIRNGTDLRKFDTQLRSPDTLRAELGIGASDPIIIVPARLAPQKGHEVLLRALPEVISECPNVRVLCVGGGELDAELKSACTAAGLDNHVRWLGFRRDMPELLALSDFVVLPSFYEGLPIAMIEAHAAGRPAVATKVDGTPEIVIDGLTGLLVPPGEPAQLAAAISRMLRDASLRQTLGRNARSWALKEFSESQQVRATERLYLELYAVKTGRRVCKSAVEAPSCLN